MHGKVLKILVAHLTIMETVGGAAASAEALAEIRASWSWERPRLVGTMEDAPAASFSGEGGASEAAVTGSGGLKNTGKGDPPMGEPLISTSSYGHSRRHHHTASVPWLRDGVIESVQLLSERCAKLYPELPSAKGFGMSQPLIFEP